MIGAGAFSATATGIGISITAIDATANAFRAVSAKASAFKADITGIGAAFKAASLKLLPVASFAAIGAAAKRAITDMGALSDRAADAGVAAPMLQKLAGALGEVGVKGASIEMVAHAMQFMARTTGEVGAEGFARVLGQASRLGTEAERLDFLCKAFGRTQGAAFAAIVRDGGPALESLLSLAAAYPAVSDEAVNAGDRAADALTRASDAIKAGWQSMLGELVLGIESVFGPLPDVAAKIANGIIIAFKAVADTIKGIFLVIHVILDPIFRTVATLVQTVGLLSRAVTDSSYSFSEAFADIGAGARAQFGEMLQDWEEKADGLFDFSNVGAKAETKPVFDGMREALSRGGVSFRNEAAKGLSATTAAISNAFSKGGALAFEGSNEARKIIMGGESMGAGVLDPQKQIARAVPAIADGIARIASNTGEFLNTFGELEAI